MRFIHTADIHLDSPMHGLARYDGAPEAELRGATRRAFVQLVDYACAEKIDALLVAGDLYDGDWRDFNTGLFFCQQLARLADAGIDVVICSGNHDAQSVLTRRLRLPANATLLDTRTPQSVELVDGELVVHGQGYSKRDLRENIVRGYPEAVPDALNVGLLHTALEGRDGHDKYAPCSLDDLLALEYDYFGLGHVHGREVVSADPPVVFPGNLQGRNWRECGAKGATLVTVDEGRIASVEHESFDVVRWVEVDLDATNASSRDDLVSHAHAVFAASVDEAEGRLVALRARITGTTSLHAGLVDQIDPLQADLRALAIEIAADQLWLVDPSASSFTRPARVAPRARRRGRARDRDRRG